MSAQAVTAASPKRVVLQHDPSIVIVGTGFLSPGRAATSSNRVPPTPNGS
jgi:hypothetical protein